MFRPDMPEVVAPVEFGMERRERPERRIFGSWVSTFAGLTVSVGSGTAEAGADT